MYEKDITQMYSDSGQRKIEQIWNKYIWDQ